MLLARSSSTSRAIASQSATRSTTVRPLSVVRCPLLSEIGDWRLLSPCLLVSLSPCPWSVVGGRWSFVVRRSSFVVRRHHVGHEMPQPGAVFAQDDDGAP